MTRNERIKNELQDIFSMTDADEYPECHNYLGYLLFEFQDTFLPSSDEIANELRSHDLKKPLPQFLFDFIVELYNEEIENGNSDAMNNLGALYYDGRGCERDYTKAMYYYNMSAEHGNAIARENLGYCYYYGRNVEIDYKKAYEYFSLGAFCGLPISLYKIGDMYSHGYYVEKDEQEAFRIYEHCLDIMDEETAKDVAGPLYLRLGKAFLSGKGTKQDAQKALICFQKSELFLTDMIIRGNTMYKGSLNAAIIGQTKARQLISGNFPQGI